MQVESTKTGPGIFKGWDFENCAIKKYGTVERMNQ
jgi:hypothetical protein